MRIVFMGTPDFSVTALEQLINSKHKVVGVVTQPDKPKGRGKHMQCSPVKEKALEHQLPIYQPLKAKDEDFVKAMKKLKPDVMVVIAFGQILPKSILDIPKKGCVNVHASLLPKYRGASPIQWAILNGEEETGVTTMYMDEGLDTGDMILTSVTKIEPKETGESLFHKLSEMGAKLLIETLELIDKGTAPRIPQNNNEATYTKIIQKELGLINWEKSAKEIERVIRGLNSWPSAYTYLDSKTLKLWEAEIVEAGEYSQAKTGTIVFVDKHSIRIKTKDDILKITELQLEGKKRMKTDDFLRGYPVTQGTIL